MKMDAWSWPTMSFLIGAHQVAIDGQVIVISGLTKVYSTKKLKTKNFLSFTLMNPLQVVE